MDWFLPGVPPTHKPVDIDIIVVVQFRDGKIACERIYWDQATVLRQVGLLGGEHADGPLVALHRRQAGTWRWFSRCRPAVPR
jgi:hypothetical protein